ncbi:MAG: iron-containing alcohol dehydrogenase [Acidobacteriaceae bacterium]|nr:iron-containing alcohol dehydrogenase [Acidobacteriaceae bacterium]
MQPITFLQPRRLTVGPGCIEQCVAYIASLKHPRVHLISSPSQDRVVSRMEKELTKANCIVSSDISISGEPTIGAFERALEIAKERQPTCILGIGGGSPLDVAKLVAAFLDNTQTVHRTFGIGLLASRNCHLVCVPTTSGTGSEVSPNAILLDEEAQLKKGVISPHLVPDATFVDPELTRTVPPDITAYTGLDALTHCIEAYTNAFSHPLVDLYAIRGIELATQHLVTAVQDGANIEARTGMSLASLYGGLCLGPVNTAAVHALAYPLGGEFHIAHGLSNAVLLPAVFRFNAQASPLRHAAVAIALGAEIGTNDMETALRGVQRLRTLSIECGVLLDLGHYGIRRSDVPHLAEVAMTVTRLLKNNPRVLQQEDVEQLYLQSFA